MRVPIPQRAEPESFDNESFYRALIDGTTDITMLLHEDATIRFVTPSVERWLGYKPDELLGTNPFTIVHPSYVARLRAALAEVLGNPGVSSPFLEVCLRHKDASWKYFEAMGRTLEGGYLKGSVIASLRSITDRKHLESELRNSRDFLEQIINRIGDPIFVKDSQHRFVLVNGAFCRLMNTTREHILGKTDHDFFPKEQSDLFWQRDNLVFETGKEDVNEEPLTDADGVTRTIVTHKAALQDIAGHNLVVGVIRDITESKRAEEKLRQAEEDSRGIFENAIAGMYRTTREGRFIAANAAMARILGYDSPRHLIEGVADIAHQLYVRPGDRAIFERLVDARGSISAFAFECYRKDGSIAWVSDSTRSVYDKNGEFQYYEGIVDDITVRRQADLEINRLALAVEHAQEAIVITEPNGTIVYVNPAFERVSGYRSDEAIGRNPSVLKSGRQDAAFYANLWATLARGEVWSGTFVNRRKDGSLYVEDGTISPVRDSAGQVVHYVAVKRDITLERSLEDQLRQSQKLEAVGRLAAGIAHEINTPIQYVGDSAHYLANAFRDTLTAFAAYSEAIALLNAIPGHEEAVRKVAQTLESADIEFAREEIPQAIDRVLEGVARVSAIVRAMKDFAHPDERERTAADLNKMLATTLTVARNEYKTVATIETDFGDLPPVLCHVGDLNQVFLNLIVNAAQAMAERSARTNTMGTIALRTRLEGDHAIVEIADDGPGVPESIRMRVFDPFFTTKPVGQGTGQGLAIARSIVVDKHHGTLTLDSGPEKGATFTIRLPLMPQLQSKEAA